MLDVDNLQKSLQVAFEEVLPSAFEEVMRAILPMQSSDGDEKVKAVKEFVKDLISEDLSTRIASAIDYYVKNADVYGSLITTGSPITHMVKIESPSPLTNGKVPNTLGIK